MIEIKLNLKYANEIFGATNEDFPYGKISFRKNTKWLSPYFKRWGMKNVGTSNYIRAFLKKIQVILII